MGGLDKKISWVRPQFFGSKVSLLPFFLVNDCNLIFVNFLAKMAQKIATKNCWNFELGEKNAELAWKFGWVRPKNWLQLGSKNRKNNTGKTIF